MGFGNVKPAGFRRSGPASATLLVEFVGADIADPRKSSGEKDTFKVVHIRGGLGKQAGEADVMRLGKYEKKEGGKDRPSIWDHLNGKNRVNPAKPGTVYLVQEAVRAADGTIEARWLKNLGPSLEDPENKSTILPGIMAKMTTPSANREGVYTGGPRLFLLDTDRAIRVGGHALKDGEVALTAEDLAGELAPGVPRSANVDDAIKAALGPAFAGEPGFMLRIIPDEGTPFSVSFTLPREKKGEEWVNATPEEALEIFKKREADLYKAVLTEKDGFAEIVPFVVVNAGKLTKERALEDIQKQKEKDPTNRYPKDRTSAQFYGEVSVEDGDKVKIQNRACFMDSVIGIRTMDPASGYRFWTDAYPMDRRKYADAEILTDNLSDDIAAKFTAAATERGKFKAKEPKNEQAEAPEENFGEDPQVEGAASPAPGR